ncbi:hypothetical protein ACNOYE_36840 [Nannocystaceae bacterium ST9]
MPLERVVDGGAELVLDDRLSPILIATWFGSATPRTVDAFHAWVDERIADARSRGDRLTLVNDSIDADRPAPEARRKFTEHELDASVLVASPVVLTNPLVRGAMTAIGWVLGDKMKGVHSSATLPEAFEHARNALREVGARPPPPSRLNGYQRPGRSPVAALGRR